MINFIRKLWALRWLFLKIYIFFIVLGLIANIVTSFLWLLVNTFFFCLTLVFIGIALAELEMRFKKK